MSVHKQESDLSAAIRELRDLVDAEMKRRHDRGGPVSRDVITARVLAANPAMHNRIEALATADPLHKAQAVRPGEQHPMRKSIEAEVSAEAEAAYFDGQARTMDEARAQAWQSDRERLDAYHFPGVEKVGSAAITAIKTKRAADRAIVEIGKVLAPGDAVLDHRLACSSFPKLAAAARGAPRVIGR